MAIEKKLICFARLEEFERQLAAGNILDYSIVFIQDAKKIWNRGTYYDCSTLTESDIAAMGFTKNTGTYSKPSGGIPKTDLASAVQTSLGKADTALQSYTEQYKGTVTGVKVNGTTKSPASGTVDIGNVVTSIKINGSTKTPSSGVVDLGTISGDSSSDVYVTDFTMQDIIYLLEGYTDRCNMAKNSLISAIENNRRIIVPCGVTEVGYYHIEGYVDDLLYLLIISYQRGLEFISIETSLSNSYCTSDEVYTTKLPIKVSDLSNDSNFISSDNLKTINGESILGSGNITISGGVSQDYVNTAIANAITTTLNTAV